MKVLIKYKKVYNILPTNETCKKRILILYIIFPYEN